MKQTVIQTRVDPEVKNCAEKIFNSLGVTLNDGIRMFLNHVMIDNGFPFRPTLTHYPNKQTCKIIEKTDKGIGVQTFSSVEDLINNLRT